MACVSEASIIGGGIAGLAAALALARVGVKCDVVELSDAPTGASLGISGRAAEALAELGVYDECHATGTPFDSKASTSITAIMDTEGRVLSPGPKRPEWPGARDGIGVYRPVLLDIMADTAQRLGVTIRRGITATNIEDGENASVVTFSDGEQRRYDLVIGADGIGSRTRGMVFPDAPKPAYVGQVSIRWMVSGPSIPGAGWYVGPVGRLGFYELPQGIYVAAVVSMPQFRRMPDEEVHELYIRLLDSFTAPAVVELRRRLTPESELIARPFEWIFLPRSWHRGRTLLVGDAAHATTAHMGMGGGMALEDAAVLGQCIGSASTLDEAFGAFMARRFERVRTVVETSVKLSHLEEAGASPEENRAVLMSAFQTLAQPY